MQDNGDAVFTIKNILSSIFWVLFYLVFAASFLYVLGNIKLFTERTQIFLLKTTALSGLLIVFCGILNIILNVKLLAEKRKKHLAVGAVFYLICGAFGFVLAVFAIVILVLTRGNIE